MKLIEIYNFKNVVRIKLLELKNQKDLKFEYELNKI
jgi:hypothetical protein